MTIYRLKIKCILVVISTKFLNHCKKDTKKLVFPAHKSRLIFEYWHCRNHWNGLTFVFVFASKEGARTTMFNWGTRARVLLKWSGPLKLWRDRAPHTKGHYEQYFYWNFIVKWASADAVHKTRRKEAALKLFCSPSNKKSLFQYSTFNGPFMQSCYSYNLPFSLINVNSGSYLQNSLLFCGFWRNKNIFCSSTIFLFTFDLHTDKIV